MEMSNIQQNALRGLIKTGIDNGATLLNQILKQPVLHSTIDISSVNCTELDTVTGFDKNASTVLMSFNGQLTGKVKLILSNNDALELLGLIAPGITVDTEIGQVKKNVLMEVGNIIINGIIAGLFGTLKVASNYTLPQYRQGDIPSLFEDCKSGVVILADTRYEIQNLKIQSSFLIFLELNSYHTLCQLLNESFIF